MIEPAVREAAQEFMDSLESRVKKIIDTPTVFIWDKEDRDGQIRRLKQDFMEFVDLGCFSGISPDAKSAAKEAFVSDQIQRHARFIWGNVNIPGLLSVG